VASRWGVEARPWGSGQPGAGAGVPSYLPLADADFTVAGLAEALGGSRPSINELLRERRASSPEMELRLSRLFGNSAELWLHAQRGVDLWVAAQALTDDVARIKPLRLA